MLFYAAFAYVKSASRIVLFESLVLVPGTISTRVPFCRGKGPHRNRWLPHWSVDLFVIPGDFHECLQLLQIE